MELPAPRNGRPDLLIVAGEHSGDEHAARVVQAFRTTHPHAEVACLGGPELERAGAQLLYEMTASSVVGLVEVLKHYGHFKALFEATLTWIRTWRPRAVMLVDYPGFNLRLASALAELGVSRQGEGSLPVLYYISPQIWAWKAHRRFQMAATLDSLAVIFPFEREVYADTRLPVTFVGHPFVAPGYELPVRSVAGGPLLLLPGSRGQPVRRIFPTMAAAFARLRTVRPALGARVLYPREAIRDVLRELGADDTAGIDLVPVEQGVVEGGAVLTSSGTMSLACALAGLPGAIVYRAHPFTYAVGRRVVRVPWLGMANIVLGRAMYPEYLQDEATPEVLEAEARAALDDPARRERAANDARALHARLGTQAEMSPAEWLARWLD